MQLKKKKKKQNPPALTHPLSFLQLQIKLTSWLVRGRGDLVFSQIICVFCFASVFSSCHFFPICF